MEALSREQGETAILTAPCGLEAIVLHTVEAEHARAALLRRRSGARPMHLGASGKVLAAYLEATSASGSLTAVGDPALAGALDGDPRARLGQSTTGELDRGVSAVAAPVLDPRGRLLAGLSVAGPSERMAAPGLEAADARSAPRRARSRPRSRPRPHA